MYVTFKNEIIPERKSIIVASEDWSKIYGDMKVHLLCRLKSYPAGKFYVFVT